MLSEVEAKKIETQSLSSLGTKDHTRDSPKIGDFLWGVSSAILLSVEMTRCLREG
jgi:hypothetical protein